MLTVSAKVARLESIKRVVKMTLEKKRETQAKLQKINCIISGVYLWAMRKRESKRERERES